jgi:Domain of unknown function (DUF4157)
MFAANGRASSKRENMAARESSRHETTPADSARVNPLWQSLAMRPDAIQPKLTIGQADDPYEREADRVADQVIHMPASQSGGHGLAITPVTSNLARRKESRGAAESPATAPPIVQEALSSPGHPIDAAIRTYFEPRFGNDLGGVRLHTDARAAESAQAMDALAYTVGRDIVFGAGQYNPHTHTGRRLVAHELTHVVQQHNGAEMIQRAEVDDNPDFCSAQGGSPALPDVSSVINGWIAETQAYGQKANLDLPTLFINDFAKPVDMFITVVAERIANLPRDQVRHVSLEESRYQVPKAVELWYRSRKKSPIAPVINLCGVCVGSDKIGHFFHMGGEYFHIGEALRNRIQPWTPEERNAFLEQIDPGVLHSPLTPEDQIIEIYTKEYGKWLEGFPNRLSENEIEWIQSNNLIPGYYFEGIYGSGISGVLSRADLEANLQGSRFYRDAMRDPNAALDICQYVNDNWSEYYNPSSYGGAGMFNPVSGPVAPIEAIGDNPIILELGGKGVDATIPFDTGSYHPNDMAMEALANRLVLYQDTLQRGEYHIDFKGHASRLSGEEYNQGLSLQRAQAVKGRLAFLLGLAMGNLDFEFDSDLIHVDGYGEERARDIEKKSPDDNSQSDRVVEVVFEVR